MPPEGLIDLRIEAPSLLFVIGYASPMNFTGAPLPGYAVPGAWLHVEAAAALLAVLADLEPRGLTLVVYDAYRPVRATEAMVAWCERNGREDLLRGYVGRTSRHNRGAAIDVGLAHLDTGGELAMGTAWDAFERASWVANAWGPARAHRRLLAEAMQRRGFRDYAKEWWHFELPLDPMPPLLDVPYA